MRLPLHESLSVAAATLCVASGALAQTNLDWTPGAVETLLNTDVTQMVATNGTPVTVTGGIFVFRNVTIPANRTVRGIGSRPMIWIVSGRFTVDGTLSVDGGDGNRVNTLNSANFATPGGVGVCGGGSGGDGSPNTGDRSFVGASGLDGGSLLPIGGRGGQLECRPSPIGSGSGGGGGSFATVGDPWYRIAEDRFIQLSGTGGAGAFTFGVSTLPGGTPGSSPFVDGVDHNNFIGRAFNLNLGRPTNIGTNGGEIRPTPILMPLF